MTGVGVVAPNGVGTENYWAATLAGRTGIAPVTRFDAAYGLHFAGEVSDFDAASWVPGRLRAQTDRWTHFSFAAADLALRDAQVDLAQVDEYEMSVYSASSAAGAEFGQIELTNLWSGSPRDVSAYQSIAWFYAATTGQLSIRHGMRGPCGVVVSEQAGGIDVMACARRALGAGTRLALVGGTEAPMSPFGVVCLMAENRMSTITDPRMAFLPFDPEAGGAVPGEGGAFMVVESVESATHRGVHAYATVAGYAATFDPRPDRDRLPVRSGLRRAIELALEDAGCNPHDIDLVFADAAGLPRLDRLEAEALNQVFGKRAVAVTAPKTMTGRLFAGGAALDVATAALALRDQVVPPTVGLRRRSEDYPISLVAEAEHRPLRTVLVLARGHGGFNSALVLSGAHR